MKILKRFTNKRHDNKVTIEKISEQDFPIISEDVLSVIEYFKSQMESERFFLDLSEGGRYGSLCGVNYIINKLQSIKDVREDKYKED